MHRNSVTAEKPVPSQKRSVQRASKPLDRAPLLLICLPIAAALILFLPLLQESKVQRVILVRAIDASDSSLANSDTLEHICKAISDVLVSGDTKIDIQFSDRSEPTDRGGALTFSSGFQSIFKKAGSLFASGGGALVGAGLTGFVESLATKSLTKRRSRRHSEIAIATIELEQCNHEPQTDIVSAYYNNKLAQVRSIEKDYLMNNEHMDFSFALGASAIEAGAAFLIVSTTGGLALALLSAALPVTVIWIVSAFQSDRLEFPEACEDLIPAYEISIPTNDLVTEDEMLKTKIVDARVRHLSGNGKFSSLAQAGYIAEAAFSWQRTKFYEECGIQESRDCHEQHKKAVQSLPALYAKPKLELTDLSPAEQRLQERVITGQMDEWIAAETQKLEQALADDLTFIRAEYGQQVNSWRARALRAEANARNHGNTERDLGNKTQERAA
jgi:hypothetical protein